MELPSAASITNRLDTVLHIIYLLFSEVNNHFYFLLIGELYKNSDSQKAKLNFQKAYSLAKTQTEKQGIQEKMDGLYFDC